MDQVVRAAVRFRTMRKPGKGECVVATRNQSALRGFVGSNRRMPPVCQKVLPICSMWLEKHWQGQPFSAAVDAFDQEE